MLTFNTAECVENQDRSEEDAKSTSAEPRHVAICVFQSRLIRVAPGNKSAVGCRIKWNKLPNLSPNKKPLMGIHCFANLILMEQIPIWTIALGWLCAQLTNIFRFLVSTFLQRKLEPNIEINSWTKIKQNWPNVLEPVWTSFEDFLEISI